MFTLKTDAPLHVDGVGRGAVGDTGGAPWTFYPLCEEYKSKRHKLHHFVLYPLSRHSVFVAALLTVLQLYNLLAFLT